MSKSDSPMMVQYHAAKKAHPGCLLFFRMGDFFEMFFDDAVTAAEALGITLTKRGRDEDGREVPMAGVPAHAHEGYLNRLIEKGFRVAVCEQVETPQAARKRGGRTLVQRDVVRVVTPGTLTEDGLLDARTSNLLIAVAAAAGGLGLAALELSTGRLILEPLAPDGLAMALARLDPAEILLPDRIAADPAHAPQLAGYAERLTPQPDSRFDSRNAKKRIADLFDVGTLEGFGDFSRAEIAALGALLDYVDLTQKGKVPRLDTPRRRTAGMVMEIDPATRRNLELTRSLSGERAGTLLATIDRTVTGAGSRLLADRLSAPLTDRAAIEARLDGVQHFGLAELRDRVRERLRVLPDLERALARLSLGRGGPRDLAAIRDGLAEAARIRTDLCAGDMAPLPPLLSGARDDLGDHGALITRLTETLVPEPPPLARDGGFIVAGAATALDEFRTLRDESRRLIAGLQADYAADTGVTGLKIKHNNVLGYFIEVTANHGDKLMARSDGKYFHRQTLANAIRFNTADLAELEQKISEAGTRALALEMEMFEDLVGAVAADGDRIARTAKAVAEIDAAASLALLAEEENYVRPRLDDSLDLDLVGGRHPVVARALRDDSDSPFVANDCTLTEANRLWLITGPNMAGKSTFLRQVALIAILAQAGSYVPADSARIGIIDRLFSRVGAADDLARGRSTFMVEMVETATILNQSTERSLVILDEIGRGTATFDGLSIAWAAIEHIHDTIRCRTLFATHYHELTALSGQLARLSCHAMAVREWRGDIIFLHEIKEGSADRSYGIHVARLAGLPRAVIGRARDVLTSLEQSGAGQALVFQTEMPLFASATRAEPEPRDDGLHREIAATDPDALSPKQALDLVYRWHNQAREQE